MTDVTVEQAPELPHPPLQPEPVLAEDAAAPLAAPAARAPPIPQGAGSELFLPTVSYVLGMGAQATFFYFLAPALTRHFATGDLDVAVFTFAAVVTMLASLAAGRLSDVHGRRPVMRLGWWGMAVGCVLVVPPLVAPALPGVPWLFAAVTLVSVGLALSFVAFMSYVADVNREEHERQLLINRAVGAPRASALARSYGASSALAVAASAVGPFAGAAVLAVTPHADLGLAAVAGLVGVFAAVAALLSYKLRTMRPEGQPGAEPITADWGRLLWRPQTDGDRGVRAMNVGVLVLGVCFGATGPYFAGHFFDVVGASPAAWATVLGVGTAVAAGAVYAAGALAGTERVHAKPFLVAVLGLGLLVVLPFPFLTGLVGAAVLYCLRTAFMNMPGPVMNGVLMVSAEPELRGAAAGASYFLWNLGWAVGALVGGVAFVLAGPWLFPAGGVVGLLAALLAVWLLPPAPEPTSDEVDVSVVPVEASPLLEAQES